MRPEELESTLVDDCVFCSIIRGELPAQVVAEDEWTIAFLDVSPAAPGHVLVVPKGHYRRLQDVAPELLGPLFGSVQCLLAATQRVTGADGALVVVNTTVGQDVPHAHVHVVPRWEDDALAGWQWPHVEGMSEAERTRIAEELRGAMRQGV